MEKLLMLLYQIEPLSQALIARFNEVLKFKAVKKNEFLLRAGETARHLHYIEKGLFRCYYEMKGKEISSWFMGEGEIIASAESFLDQKISKEYIKALEDSEVYYIDYDDLEGIYADFPEFNKHGRIITKNYYVESEKRLHGLRALTAIERYILLEETRPDLIQRVPSKYLASYLDMLETTLSRIRSQRRNGGSA